MVQLGLRIEDLDLLDTGVIFDMMNEAGNDSFYADKKNRKSTVRKATQEDFDKF